MATEKPEKLQEMLQAIARELDAEEALFPIDKDGNELRVRTE